VAPSSRASLTFGFFEDDGLGPVTQATRAAVIVDRASLTLPYSMEAN
jgi:hypothetical protein